MENETILKGGDIGANNQDLECENFIDNLRDQSTIYY